MADAVKQTDSAVANFTREILKVARENGVNFDYVGPKHSKNEEILKTLQVNTKAVKDLLKK